MVTINDALKLLPNLKLAAGNKGINRKISLVNIFDAPDIKNWLTGGELILTTAYNYRKKPEELADVITYLSEHNGAGIGIVLGQFIDELPQIVLAKANQVSLPILIIPPDLGWQNIIIPLMLEISSEQAAMMNRSLKIHESFNKLTMNNNIIKNSLNMLYEITNICPVFYDLSESLLYKATSPYNQDCSQKMAELSKNYLAIVKDLKESPNTILTDSQYIVTPIITNEQISGYLIGKYCKHEINTLDAVAFEYAATSIAIDLLKTKAVNEEKRRYQGDFLLEILTGKLTNKEIIQNRGAFYQWNFAGNFNIIAIDIDDFISYTTNVLQNNQNKIESLKKSIDLAILNTFKGANIPIIKYITSDCFILIINSDLILDENKIKPHFHNILNQIKLSISNMFKDLTVSIGISKSHPCTELSKGYTEALQALNIGKKIYGKRQIFYYLELDIYAFLLQGNFEEHLETFYTHTIKKIADIDIQKGSDLLISLNTYLQHLNIPLAASALFIHPNTMRYRIKKIQAITGCVLNNPNDRLKLEIGIKIHQLL